jgi:arylsulfatase A-like enzyme
MFHTTALCSPTRAALIAGRNYHTNASGVITEFARGYPGYDSLVPRSSGSVGEVLKLNGYNTSWFGKMHKGPIPRSVGVRFSLDETFDVGEDTGTPVVEDYASKIPFAFTGTLKRVVVVLETDKLTGEERKRLLQEEASALIAVH